MMRPQTTTKTPALRMSIRVARALSLCAGVETGAKMLETVSRCWPSHAVTVTMRRIGTRMVGASASAVGRVRGGGGHLLGNFRWGARDVRRGLDPTLSREAPDE